VVTEVLSLSVLILREKEGEREYGEDDDIVIGAIWHPVPESWNNTI
jgi:hypothetical protein